MKKTRDQKYHDRRRRQERRLTKERAPDGIKVSQPPAGGTPVHGAAKASSLPLAPVARTEDRASVTAVTDIVEAIPAAIEPAPDGAVNGELIAIDSLQSLAPEEREIVRQSDVAFVRVRQTWECLETRARRPSCPAESCNARGRG